MEDKLKEQDVCLTIGNSEAAELTQSVSSMIENL